MRLTAPLRLNEMEKLSDLEFKCDVCEGTGVSYGSNCPQCRGVGFVLSDEGARLLAFVKRHLRSVRFNEM